LVFVAWERKKDLFWRRNRQIDVEVGWEFKASFGFCGVGGGS
jgi:hypothetical protein